MIKNNKYFIRGIGVGIILTVSIMYISFSIFDSKNNTTQKTTVSSENESTQNEHKNDNVKTAIFIDDEINKQKDKNNPLVIDYTTEQNIKIAKPKIDNINEQKMIEVKIKPNFGYYKLASLLNSLELIDDEQDFVNYCKANSFTVFTGTYNVPENSTYDEIINIIKRR